MTVPRKRRRLLYEDSGPELPTQRERDARDLGKLALLIERGVHPNPWTRFVNEPWEVILRRHLAGEYPRADKTIENGLIARHFWLRRVVYRQEELKQTAGRIVEALKAHGIEKADETVRTECMRAENMRKARDWIAARFREYRKEFTRESIALALLGRFEPTANAESEALLKQFELASKSKSVQRSEPSSHRDR